MQDRQVMRPHQHQGPRTGQTPDETWIMSCETCGVAFVEGLEDLDTTEVEDIMRALYGENL